MPETNELQIALSGTDEQVNDYLENVNIKDFREDVQSIIRKTRLESNEGVLRKRIQRILDATV